MRWCDMTCEHASFPKETALDGSGSCRTFQAIYCGLQKTHVQKNMPCSAPEESGVESDTQKK